MKTREVCFYDSQKRWCCLLDTGGLSQVEPLKAASTDTGGPPPGPEFSEIAEDLLLLLDRTLDTIEVRAVYLYEMHYW